MGRRLVISAAVALALVGLADRGLAVLASSAVATAVQRAEDLPEKPDVTFRGFPFVTQALRGRFQRVDVTARDVERGGIVVSRLDVALTGVRVGLSDAVRGRVNAVPVEEGSATATLGYADLNAYLAKQRGRLSVSPRDTSLLVRGDVALGGGVVVAAEGLATVSVQGDAVRVTVRTISGVDRVLPAAVAASAAPRFSFDVPVRGLPFDVELRDATVGSEGVRVSAAARGLVLSAR